MSYDRAGCVTNLLVIPKHFFSAAVIEQRKPLSPTARRAGWVGCNILVHGVPHSGRIFLVRNGLIAAKSDVLAQWRRTLFLREQQSSGAKGWLLSVMRCVEKMGLRTFSLEQVYAFEEELRWHYPKNLHIRPKIRQQLQVLRDKGYLEFTGGGFYRLTQ
jgi:type II restriction enzyme